MRGRQLGTRWGGKRAFQLVEVVLSLGISSFALLLVLALIPLGLNVVQESREEAAKAELLAHLHREAKRYSERELTSRLPTQRFYYDQHGRATSSENLEESVYVAEIRPSLLNEKGLPGFSAFANLWSLRVVVSSLASGQEVLRDSFHLSPSE